MKLSTLLLIAAVLVIPSVMFKYWQCGELFPDANRLACILWK